MPDNPQQNVTFPTPAGEGAGPGSGQGYGYLALPPTGTGPGLVVIQEWWGLESSLAHTTDAFAQAGFVALAPDLYGGTTTHDAQEAGRLMAELPAESAARDLAGAVDFLLDHDAVTGGAVGAVGICMGGAFVLSLAAQQAGRIGAGVVFYPVFPGEVPNLAGLTAPVQGHFGGADDYVPAERVEAIKAAVAAAGVDPEFFVYDDAGHAFGNPENLIGTHDEAAGQLAFERATAFLHQHLG